MICIIFRVRNQCSATQKYFWNIDFSHLQTFNDLLTLVKCLQRNRK